MIKNAGYMCISEASIALIDKEILCVDAGCGRLRAAGALGCRSVGRVWGTYTRSRDSCGWDHRPWSPFWLYLVPVI